MSQPDKEKKILEYPIQTFTDLDWDGEVYFDIESKALRKYTINLACASSGADCAGGGDCAGGPGDCVGGCDSGCDSGK